MILIGCDDDRSYNWIHSETFEPVDLPFEGEPFVCLIANCISNITDEEINILANYLVESNSRDTVCHGYKCEMIHDAINRAIVNIKKEEDIDCAILTTWHEDEPIDNAVDVVRGLTYPDDCNYVLLLTFGEKDEAAKYYFAILKSLSSNN